MTGPNAGNLIATVLTINITNLLSFSFTWIDYINDHQRWAPLLFGLFMWAITDYALYRAAFCDPGLLPRQTKDPYAIEHRPAFKSRNYLVRDGFAG